MSSSPLGRHRNQQHWGTFVKASEREVLCRCQKCKLVKSSNTGNSTSHTGRVSGESGNHGDNGEDNKDEDMGSPLYQLEVHVFDLLVPQLHNLYDGDGEVGRKVSVYACGGR